MADPRFYDNRGPVALEALCAKIGVGLPSGADGRAQVRDIAGLTQAGPQHLAFFDGGRAKEAFARTKAGWCLVKEDAPPREAPDKTILLPCPSVAHAFAAAGKLFYPEDTIGIVAQDKPVHPSARLGDGVLLSPGVVIGPNAEIGRQTRIGPNTVIGRGVTVGRNSEIGANVWIGFAHLGDEVLVLPGARIGTPGFGFASTARGHTKTPQVGRVIVQDRVEIGANTTIDRGALGDTVIGEGSKIDNLVHIGHNCALGRHCIIAGLVGMAGSVTLGDFVVVGGKAGFADHATIGASARIAGMSGVFGDLPGGKDYGGIPARAVRNWHKETATLSRLAKTSRRVRDE
jgi:UDP-3-O-[3-hydroxymyristoyl] glucosamine N-acyltransferase